VLVRKWPLKMDAQHLFDEPLLVAARLGVEIRIEPFETPATMGGGLCIARGEELVLIDRMLHSQIAFLVSLGRCPNWRARQSTWHRRPGSSSRQSRGAMRLSFANSVSESPGDFSCAGRSEHESVSLLRPSVRRGTRWISWRGECGRKEEDERPASHRWRWVGRPMLALCRPPDISMMQATNFGNLHDGANLRPLDRSHVGRILLQREVSASAVIVREVAGQEMAEVPLAENEHVVQTLVPD